MSYPLRQTRGKMKGWNMKTNQMELGLTVNAARPGKAVGTWHTRSGWWFQQMRKAVDTAGVFYGDSGKEREKTLRAGRASILEAAEAA